MDLVSPILEVSTMLCGCMARQTQYIHDLEHNLSSLANKMRDLKMKRDDVKAQVQLAVERKMGPTNQGTGWLGDVEKIEAEVKELCDLGWKKLEKKCLGSCTKYRRSTHKLGKEVSKMIESVAELTRKGDSLDFAMNLPRAAVDVIPLDKTVGLDEILEVVWEYVEDENIGVIGIYGMGGVGKTTLMKKLNNEFDQKSNTFEVVIWVGVSIEGTKKKVQDEILNMLELPVNQSWNENARVISNNLNGKKFALLLDDVWKSVDLTDLGVPRPNKENKSMVIFTTRSEEVCGHMEASKKIRVQCLTEKQALDLFQEKVGLETLNSHPEIPELAKIAAAECGGLPLALITIGRAMASRKTVEEWKNAVKILKDVPSKLSGMGVDVFPTLKFSYDSLSNDTLRTCFIYCSLYPDDYNIKIEELINLWIGEDILNDFSDIDDARNQALTIIGDLKRACLLESGRSEKYVRMHDVVRDMALWIASDCGTKINNFVTKELKNQLVTDREVEKWEEAKRMSLTGVMNIEVTHVLKFPSLLSFLKGGACDLPSEFFTFMPVIKVLDLSYDIFFTELPIQIENLGSLQYLNLSETRIKELPGRLSKFPGLKYLNLDNSCDINIRPGQLESLSMLQVLYMWGINAYEGFLDELENLKHLVYAKITLNCDRHIQKFESSQKLQRYTRAIQFELGKSSTSLLVLNQFEHVEVLEFRHGDKLQGFKYYYSPSFGDLIRLQNLHNVVIHRCSKLRHLTWLILAPNLRFLKVTDCDSMEEIIRSGDRGFEPNLDMFSRLEKLQLGNLQGLTSICNQPLPFPRLREIRVNFCEKLKKLPLDSHSAENSLERIQIQASARWWNELEWEDIAIERVFFPYVRYTPLEASIRTRRAF